MSGQFVDQVARSARLYQRGLITAQEFTNVTLQDLRRLDDERCRARHDGSGRCIREMGHPGPCRFARSTASGSDQ